MKVITIKFNNEREWKFLYELLNRLNIRFDWREEAIIDKKMKTPPQNVVAQLFGSFPSDKTSDELVDDVYGARVN